MKLLITSLLAGWLFAVAATAATTNTVAPVTGRDFYNAGTQLLTEKKYAEAEKMFLSALAMQTEAIQPIALFNLGHARYAEGAELLKKGPDAQQVKTQGNALLAEGERVLVNGEAALAENNLEKMISSYLEGRGVQKELKRAEKVVQAAMETYGKTLAKWQRSADDFTGAAELNSADTNAQHNAELVRQDLAKLIDSLRQMQQMANAMGKQRQDLGKLLSKLKGQIPAPNAPPGSTGEEDDEEEGKEAKPGMLAGKEEKVGSEGQESATPLSPDQAGKILDGISVDGSRRLSMSDKQGTPPKDKNGRNW
jgi:tetratricopeptide (TPR) repeat protein